MPRHAARRPRSGHGGPPRESPRTATSSATPPTLEFRTSHALDLYSQSYQNWTHSYRGNEAQVSEAHSATTAELGQAIGRAANHFTANYDRYEESFADIEIPRETLEARARTVAGETTHDTTQAQDHHIGALRA